MTDANERKPQRFNHVAMSVPAATLSEVGCKELLGFYGEVFGWDEMPTMTEFDKRLVLRAQRNEQFVFLIADDNPMTCPRLDHFGLSVTTLEELEELHAKCVAYRERDDRVDIIDVHADEHPMITLTSFYVRYLLPMMVEVQHWGWKPAAPIN